PLQSLYFLLPMLLLYEAGSLMYAPVHEVRLPPILAESLLDDFFRIFGVSGYYVPGLVVVVVLISLHLVRRDPWKPEWRLYVMMFIESVALALPLFMFMLVLFREADAAQTAAHTAMNIGGAGAHGGWGVGGWGWPAVATDAR